jgi:hypothetical protein
MEAYAFRIKSIPGILRPQDFVHECFTNTSRLAERTPNIFAAGIGSQAVNKVAAKRAESFLGGQVKEDNLYSPFGIVP